MILTVTPNPSLDRTLEMPSRLERGEVQRATATRSEAGGKGINVSRVIAEAGIATRALLPARDGDPLLRALDAVDLPYETVAVDGEIRSNITIAEPDGTTTKLNAPGQQLTDAQLVAFTDLVERHAAGASWVTLCGSLPPGMPVDWYRRLVDGLADVGCRIAVDTSGAPLHAAALGRVDLLKPNEDELAEVTGADAAALRRSAAEGRFGPIVDAARSIVDRTGGAVLATLGATGAILTTPDGSWFATPPPIVPRSTVGAGDSSLAGYLIAQSRDLSAPERLRSAVAYGSAAAALAGTQAPTPDQLDLAGVRITELTGATRVT